MSGLGPSRVVLDRVLASLSVVGASFFGAGFTGAGALEPGPTRAVAGQVDKVAAVGLELALPGGVQLGTAQVAPPAAPGPRPHAPLTRHLAGFWEDLPTSTALLIPVAFGLALLVGLALGPSGRPQPVGQRAGGLSRALDRRRGGEGVI